MKKYFNIIISSVLGLVLIGCGGNTPTKKPVVVNPPTISEFTATPSTIIVGEETTLNWTIEGTNPINVGITSLGDVTGTSAVVSPTQTTSYTITASNSAASVTKEVSVVVNPVPEVQNPDTPVSTIKALIPSAASAADAQLWCEEYKVGFKESLESDDGAAFAYTIDCYEIAGDSKSFKAEMTKVLTDAGYSMTSTFSQTDPNGITVTAEAWELGANAIVVSYIGDLFVVITL